MYDPWFDSEGEMLAVGQQYIRKEYAQTLQLLADGHSMYEGELAEGIVEAVQKGGGLLTLEDLKCRFDEYGPDTSVYDRVEQTAKCGVQRTLVMDSACAGFRSYLAECHGDFGRVWGRREWIGDGFASDD